MTCYVASTPTTRPRPTPWQPDHHGPDELTGRTTKLNAWGHRYADTYRALNRGAHVAHDGDLRLLTADARALVAKIRAVLS